MDILENISLAARTTFFIGGPARYFCVAENTTELSEALNFAKQNKLPVFILGAGSNILVSDQGYFGLVIHLSNKGVGVRQDGNKILLTAQAGENWDSVVAQAVSNGWWGIENLSHIPGNVGAFAVQNVGAYGQEASQVIEQLEVFDTTEQKISQLVNSQCQFRYRSSIFNREQKGRYVILSVTLKLSNIAQPNLSYGDMALCFSAQSQSKPTLAQIREAIIEIRNKKFPFPNKPSSGSAGSFFRGPLIPAEQWHQMRQRIKQAFGEQALLRLDGMADRLQVSSGYKTPTAFLIELCGYKNSVSGGARVNPNQPAVILNDGSATAADVLDLYNQVKMGVEELCGVSLEHEPEFVGF